MPHSPLAKSNLLQAMRLRLQLPYYGAAAKPNYTGSCQCRMGWRHTHKQAVDGQRAPH